MLGADYLFQLDRYLDDQSELDHAVVDGLNEALEAIYALPDYQQWLDGASEFASQYSLPPNFGTELSGPTKRLLERFLIINGSFVEVKIDKHGNRVHLTDGGWVPSAYRVYPYADESKLLCDYIVGAGLHDGTQLLIDPACGCGHHGLALSMIPTRVYLDINIRALAFCRINSILSGSEQMLSGINDIRQGFPLLFDHLHCDRALVVVNMPFAIFPQGPDLPQTLAQDGGDRGVALTFAVLEAVKKLARTAPSIKQLRLVMLFYSLGARRAGGWHWEVEDKARMLFPDADVSVTTPAEKMWRVNGVKAENSPMDLSRMDQKARCRQTFAPDEMEPARKGYLALEAQFRKEGYSHLGYGILDVKVR